MHSLRSPCPTLFVTGTDTGVGKTRISLALLHAAQLAGLAAVGMKPLASGCTLEQHGWRNDDALALQAASSGRPDYPLVNPYALPLASAPEIAARAAAVRIEPATVLSAQQRLCAPAQLCVLEGVGGWLAPLSADWMQADLARALDAQVVLVVALRLGCINHALLSYRAIVADGLPLRGWIVNRIDPQLQHADEYLDCLQRHIPAPMLGCLEFAEAPQAAAPRLLRALQPLG